jgi:hypothetical protein
MSRKTQKTEGRITDNLGVRRAGIRVAGSRSRSDVSERSERSWSAGAVGIETEEKQR